MTKRIGVVVCAISAAIAIGWAVPQVRGAEDIKEQIAAANAGFIAAFGASDAKAVAACYTADGQVFPTGTGIVSGAAAIEAFWGGMMGGPVKTLKLITTEAEQHGDTAIEVGRVELFDAAGEIADTLKYIVIWKRIDGQWKMHRDIFNSNSPAS